MRKTVADLYPEAQKCFECGSGNLTIDDTVDDPCYQDDVEEKTVLVSCEDCDAEWFSELPPKEQP